MSGRSITALVASPVCAAIAYAVMVLATLPPLSARDAPQPGALLISSLAVTGIFELFVLLPLWYTLRGATFASRALLCLLGVMAWFLAASALGALLGHGGAMAISFGISLLFPGVVLAIVFAAVMPARASA